ncbi:hypothetical protein RJ640_028095 [Escallonia rubra]|uniref:Peptidase C1A papain C-terminal domain-containing protein n=1 Tax=Escallonia rubra TaxID=112253 RepID=A0AA88QV15_9ASTE|nr:hypothetical protein RJ640_028095 [Escallonia rubra]
MQHMMVHGIQSPPTLSRQELVEFADEHPYPGCRGTNVGAAFQYIKKNGIYAEDCFPYMDGVRRSEENIPFPTGKEHKIPENDRYRIAGYRTFSMQNYNDDALRRAVVKFPIVATLVTDNSFSSRFGRLSPWKGVTNYFSSHNSLHCVNVVGFNFVGDDQSQWYYEVKNTHGEDFGESGYTTIAPGLIIEIAFPIVHHSASIGSLLVKLIRKKENRRESDIGGGMKAYLSQKKG